MSNDANNVDLKYAKNQFNKDFENIKDKACDACGAIVDTAKHARNNAKNLIQPSIDDLKEKQENLANYVKENPIKAVGLAMLAGLIISKIL
jgi:ElaB/YqjD/DUF883 family membrane-anchored ribosome-binding protein